MPTVQLLVMKLSITDALSVWLREIIPVRLLSMMLLWMELPLLLLISTPVRFPVSFELRSSVGVAQALDGNARAVERAIPVGGIVSSSVTAKPSMTTPPALT